MTIWYAAAVLGFYDDTLVPASVIPPGAVAVPPATYTALMAAVATGQIIGSDTLGNPVAVAPAPPTAPTPAQLQLIYANALSTALDSLAQAWQYDSIYTAVTYLNSAVAQFAAEAKVLTAWRDAAWNNAQVLQLQINSGAAQIPATTAAFLAIVLPPQPARPQPPYA